MAPKVTPEKKDNKGAAVAALGLGAVALLLLNKKTPSTAPTAVFMPNQGPVQTVVTVTGINWKPSEAITDVTLGDLSAYPQTLTVDADGKLSGTITVPVVGMTAGVKAVKITGALTGIKTFIGAFKVTTSVEGWMLMTPTPYTVVVERTAGAEGWLLMTVNPTTITVTRTAGAEGWLLMTASPVTLAVTRAIGAEGWLLMTASPVTLSVTRAVGAEGWLLMTPNPTVLSVGTVTYYPSLTCDATVPYGGNVDFDFAGFPPNVSVWVGVVNGGGASYSSNSNGVGSGSIGPLGEAPGNYQLEAYDNFGHRTTANFTVMQAPSQITNVVCTWFSSPVTTGATLTVMVQCDYIGPGEYVTLYGAMGNIRPIIGFDELVHGQKTIQLQPAAVKGTQEFYVDISIPSGFGAGVYDVYAKIGGVISPEYSNVVQIIRPGPTPTLTCDTFIYRNGTLHFNFSGFTPNASVWVGLVGGGGNYFTADSSGAGAAAIGPLGENPGTYTLEANDGTNHATASFTIMGP